MVRPAAVAAAGERWRVKSLHRSDAVAAAGAGPAGLVVGEQREKRHLASGMPRTCGSRCRSHTLATVGGGGAWRGRQLSDGGHVPPPTSSSRLAASVRARRGGFSRPDDSAPEFGGRGKVAVAFLCRVVRIVRLGLPHLPFLTTWVAGRHPVS